LPVDREDETTAKVTASLGATSLFLEFDAAGNVLRIPDLSSPTVLEGTYEGLKLKLQDTHDSTTI